MEAKKWQVGVMDCTTLLISYMLLDNPQLTADEALAVVESWSAGESGRRLSWLVGRSEENAKPADAAKPSARGKPYGA